MSKICVIGSMSADLTVRIPRFHAPGETITGEDFHTYTGGKGGNQAVAAGKLTDGVVMVGKLGGDSSEALYRRVLAENHIDDSCVEVAEDVSSGVALIEVTDGGENRIVVVPGANALVDRALIDRAMPRMLECELFLFQFEIPMDTVLYAARKLHEAGKRVILDPAPAKELPEGLLPCVDCVTPNETELSILSALPTGTEDEIKRAARSLVARGAKAVVAKMGARGAMYVDKDQDFIVSGFKVSVVDTTAAGDSFNAGLAVALSRGFKMPEAMRFANAVAAISTTGAGAQGAMPTLARVEAFLKEHR